MWRVAMELQRDRLAGVGGTVLSCWAWVFAFGFPSAATFIASATLLYQRGVAPLASLALAGFAAAVVAELTMGRWVGPKGHIDGASAELDPDDLPHRRERSPSSHHQSRHARVSRVPAPRSPASPASHLPRFAGRRGACNE
jgi:hypothetical protein